ncbi:MAG: iron-containing redox enzyme family protein [Acidimicrobiia bacterium]
MIDLDRPTILPRPRGPWSRAVLETVTRAAAPPVPELSSSPLDDDDMQLALYLVYELHYRGLDGVPDEMEWDLDLFSFRRRMEEGFQQALLAQVPLEPVEPTDVATELRHLDTGSSALARFMAREATLEQVKEFVVHRSAYHLKEADPHTFAIPRLGGAPKSAFAEIQADEYGGGVPERIHAHLFASMMQGLGLDPRPGAYLDRIPGTSLATVNLMSFFGLNRRWRGAAVGHLALFELGSSIPNRMYGDGLRRLGFDTSVTEFHDEHVEADAVHSMLATYDVAGRLATDNPHLAQDIVFGARALDAIEGRASRHLLDQWRRDASSLRPEKKAAA